jgi:Acyl-CoA dehydrogenase, N-terminal domain
LARKRRLPRFRRDARRSTARDGGTLSTGLPGARLAGGGGHSRHVPARGAIAGVGHNWPGGHPWGKGYGVHFSLSAEQRELTEAAAAFARRELNQDLLKCEDAGEFPPEAWRGCAKFGVQGLPVPAELGGAGADVLMTALVMEALGYGCLRLHEGRGDRAGPPGCGREHYTRAPRRSSGWYSPGCSGSEPPGQARHPRRASRREA